MLFFDRAHPARRVDRATPHIYLLSANHGIQANIRENERIEFGLKAEDFIDVHILILNATRITLRCTCIRRIGTTTDLKQHQGTISPVQDTVVLVLKIRLNSLIRLILGSKVWMFQRS